MDLKNNRQILVLGTIAFYFFQAILVADSYIEEFGATAGIAVNDGFVFMDGQYIESPYVISRSGLELFVNNRKISRPTRYPGGRAYTGDIDISQFSTPERQKLFRALEATRKIYEKYLSRGYSYLFFSSGGHVRLEPYTAVYSLPKIIQLLKSDKSRDEKQQSLISENWHLCVNIEPLLDNFSVSSELMTRLEQKGQELLRIDEFGENSEIVNEGFVFLGGQYVDVPYEVKRSGLGIFINGKMIEQPCEWPVDVPSGDEDPVLPLEINAETSINDDVVNDYLLKKYAYLRKNHTKAEECQAMEEVFRNLPFVAEVELDQNKPHILHIKTTEGVTINQSLISMRGREIDYDKASVLQRVEKTRLHFQRELEKGCCYFFSSKGGSKRLSSTNSAVKLVDIVGIIKSEKSEEQKVQELQQAGFAVSTDNFHEIITNFSASSQLEERLDELIEQQ